MFDTHIHTQFSTDSNEKIENIIDEGRKKNVGVTITDHMDLNYPRDGEFVFDADKYFEAYDKYRSDSVLIGIEMGMRLDCIDEFKALKNKYSFDNIIGSIHVIDNLDLYWDKFYLNRTKEAAYSAYFEAMLACVKEFDFINELAHMDYITRYARYDNKDIVVADFQDIIDEIFKTIIQRDIALEINIKSISNRRLTANMVDLCKRYSELNGKYVTIGSDAHIAEKVGEDFKLGLTIAETFNLKPVYFKDGKMKF